MKRLFKILAAVVVGIVLLIGVIIVAMGKKTNEVMEKWNHQKIDMELVQDGIYEGSSDGGMV